MRLEKRTYVSDIVDEEPREVIESALPLKVGEEREFGNSGIKKKFPKPLNLAAKSQVRTIKSYTYHVCLSAVHYVDTLLDRTKFGSTRDKEEPLTCKLGSGQIVTGLDNGEITMKKGECAVFTLPSEVGFEVEGRDGVPPDSVVQFEVEVVSWITVVDLSKDGGIIKKIMEQGERNESLAELDEVLSLKGTCGGDNVNVDPSNEDCFNDIQAFSKESDIHIFWNLIVLLYHQGHRMCRQIEEAQILLDPQPPLPELAV